MNRLFILLAGLNGVRSINKLLRYKLLRYKLLRWLQQKGLDDLPNESS